MGVSHPKELREKAKQLFLSGAGTARAIARQIGVERNTLQSWRRQEDWDGLRNLAEHEARQRVSMELADKAEVAKKNCFLFFSALLAQAYKVLEEYSAQGLTVPPAVNMVLAKAGRLCQDGIDIAMGRDYRVEAKNMIDVSPRRVFVDFDPPDWFHEPPKNGNGAGESEQ